MKRNRIWIAIAALILLLPVAGYFSQQVFADQPHMQAALDALKTAREQLAKASEDKGGHRKKALEHVRKAIVEVEKGIAYDRRH